MNDFRFQVIRQSSPEDVPCGQITLQVADPIYGSRLVNDFEYFLPPFFLITIFVVTMAETVQTLRRHVQCEVFYLQFVFLGMKFHELLISCFFKLLCVLFVHVALALVLLSFSIWNDLLPMEGSLTLVIALIFTEGLCGLVGGLLVYSIYILCFRVFQTEKILNVIHGIPLCYMIGKHPSYLCNERRNHSSLTNV